MGIDKTQREGTRRHIIPIRLTDSQFEMVEAAAEEADLSVSEWIRRTIGFNIFNSPSASGRSAYKRRDVA